MVYPASGQKEAAPQVGAPLWPVVRSHLMRSSGGVLPPPERKGRSGGHHLPVYERAHPRSRRLGAQPQPPVGDDDSRNATLPRLADLIHHSPSIDPLVHGPPPLSVSALRSAGGALEGALEGPDSPGAPAVDDSGASIVPGPGGPKIGGITSFLREGRRMEGERPCRSDDTSRVEVTTPGITAPGRAVSGRKAPRARPTSEPRGRRRPRWPRERDGRAPPPGRR